MIQKLSQSHGNVIGYALSGKVSQADYNVITTDLQAVVQEHDTVRLLIRMADLSGIDLDVLDDELRMTRYMNHIERYAVVGDNRLYDWMASAANKVTQTDVRHFSLDDEEKAWAWLQ